MPDLALEREALALFERLLDVAEAERDGWLADATLDRPELLSRVAAMRDADRRAQMRTGSAADSLDEEAPPERIGAYRIVERIGRGGMGSVYRGERMTGDFAHVVAIKIIKPGLLSDALIERFGRERQLLASLIHPNIAQLYDGGETGKGSPYLIMEYVDGAGLLQWAEERQPSVAERLRLFRDICSAVAFAHRNLVVHRDLTPSNILVTGDGTVKLIDFGIAKPADQPFAGAEKASKPTIGSLSLTPGYAAPERMVSGEVTTAADIYSLGKLLRRLLSPQPRDRELRAIVARATAEDPLARYPSADALRADVEAWGSGLPVAAVAGGKGYVFAKFVRRHRLAVSAAAAAVLLLAGAFALTFVAYSRAEASRRAEAARFEELRSLARFMIFDLNGQLERVVGNARARMDVANRAQTYLSALARSPHADHALRLEAARGLVALAHVQGVSGQPNLGDTERATANLNSAVAMLKDLRLPSAETVPPRVEALSALALIKTHSDADTDRASALLREAEGLLNGVPTDQRSGSWHLARRHLRKSQLDLAVVGQETEALVRLSGLLESEIGEWPATMRRSPDAEMDRALARHYRVYHGYFTDALEEGLASALDAERRLLALERARPNDPVLLFTLMWNAYVGHGVASGLPARTRESKRLLDLASTTSERLLRIEPSDSALNAFSASVRQMQSQAFAAEGRSREALELQREVVGLFESAMRLKPKPSTLNRLSIARITLGNIAIGAADRALACGSYQAAGAGMSDLRRRGELVGSVASYTKGLAGALDRCGRGAPLGEFEALDGS